jgi:hypothetical protein
MLRCRLLEHFGIVHAAMNFLVISGLHPIAVAGRGFSLLKAGVSGRFRGNFG